MNQQIYAGFMSYDHTYEVQRSNNFRIIFNMGDAGSVTSNTSATDDAIYLELACETAGLPNFTVEATESVYGNSTIKLAGKPSFDDISVTVKDFIEPDVEKILMDWQYKVYNPQTGKIGWAVNYKKQARINLYSPNGSVLRSWVAEGVWPTGIDLGEMDYSNSDLRKLTMTLSVDNAYLLREDSTIKGDYDTEGEFN